MNVLIILNELEKGRADSIGLKRFEYAQSRGLNSTSLKQCKQTARSEIALAKYLRVDPKLDISFDGGFDMISGGKKINAKNPKIGNENMSVNEPLKDDVLYVLVIGSEFKYNIMGYATSEMIRSKGIRKEGRLSPYYLFGLNLLLPIYSDKFAFCNVCSLKDRPIVHGQKGTRRDVMFIAEAPGYEEDNQGIPLVGRSGILLEEILLDLKLDKKLFSISNSVVCHPIDENGANRRPTIDEIKCCNDRLLRSISKVNPTNIIISLGAVALFALVEPEPLDKIVMSNYVGKISTSKNEYKVMPTYHPAYALRNPEYKEIIKRHIGEAINESR